MGTRSSLQESSGGCHFSDGMCVLGPFAILESVVFGRVDGPVGVSLSVCTPPHGPAMSGGDAPSPTRSPAERPVRPRRTAANTQFKTSRVVAWTECVRIQKEYLRLCYLRRARPRPLHWVKRSARPGRPSRPFGTASARPTARRTGVRSEVADTGPGLVLYGRCVCTAVHKGRDAT